MTAQPVEITLIEDGAERKVWADMSECFDAILARERKPQDSERSEFVHVHIRDSRGGLLERWRPIRLWIDGCHPPHDRRFFIDVETNWKARAEAAESKLSVCEAALREAQDAQSMPMFAAGLLMKLKEECEAQHDRAEKAEAALRDLKAWQPIETAPKDGTPVILHLREEVEVIVGAWSNEDREWIEYAGAGQPCSPYGWIPMPVEASLQPVQAEKEEKE